MSDLSKYDDKTIMDFIGVNPEEELRNRGYEYGWYKKSSCICKKDKIVGSIYVFVGSKHDNSVKIGFSENVQDYLNNLNNKMKNEEEYHCYITYDVTSKINDDNAVQLFSTLFTKAKGTSFDENWICLSKVRVYDIFLAIANMHGNKKCLKVNPFHDKYFKENASKSFIIAEFGDSVEHCSFGKGTVIDVDWNDDGSGCNTIYKVQFDNGKCYDFNANDFKNNRIWKLDSLGQKINMKYDSSFCESFENSYDENVIDVGDIESDVKSNAVSFEKKDESEVK